VGLSTLSSVCVRWAEVFWGVLPGLFSDTSEAWLLWSNHCRVEGTALAHRQVNSSRVSTRFIHPSYGNRRPKLSKSLITDASKVEWRTAADLRIKFGVTLRTSTVRGSPIPLIVSSLKLQSIRESSDCHFHRRPRKADRVGRRQRVYTLRQAYPCSWRLSQETPGPWCRPRERFHVPRSR